MDIRFVFLLFFTVNMWTQVAYDREDYKYNHTKARQKLIAYYDPYSGLFFKDPQEMEIDHIVPLKLAHDLGGYLWSREKKKIFANDKENLIMVSSTCNRKKGSKSLAQWLPKNERFHSKYRQRYNYILKKYQLKPPD